MLLSLAITNFAIIDRLEVEFGSGFNVLTGETGAGKSILVDALSFVLGERADSGLIRPGAERTEVSAEFDLSALRIATNAAAALPVAHLQRLRAACADLGLRVQGWFDSPIAGGDGNREFFIHATKT